MTITLQNIKHLFEDKQVRPVLLTVISLCLVSTVHLIKPLFDPDFYWHLKTGFWIWDNKWLPHIDPFSINPQYADYNRTKFILSSYWLFQLLLCAFYKIGGFSGIIILRFLLGAIFIFIFYRYSVSKNLSAALVGGIGITPILEAQFPERPQFISFVCCALILSLIFTYLRRENKGLFSLMIPLCLTMFLWANMHGGFLLGLILLSSILLAETIKFIHPRLLPLPSKQYFTLAISICSAILISIVNPNHLNSLEMILPSGEANSFIYTSILEFSNLYEYFKISGGNGPIIALCTYLFTLILAISSRERTNITWMVLLISLGYMGFSHIRYYPFFLICATLFALHYFDTKVMGKAAKFVLVAFYLVVITLSLSKTPGNLKRISQYGWVPASYFPVKGCDFIKANGIDGNIFTTINWGGYVIWRLSPQQKVYFDGRQLDPARSWEYFYGMDNWKAIFNKYDIRVAIVPKIDESYKTPALKRALDMDADWTLVDSANNGAVFIRKY